MEQAMQEAARKHHAHIVEFTVAPRIQTNEGLPYHEWFVEFEKEPDDLAAFAATVNEHMRERNIYYNDLITGSILQPLKIRAMQKHAFIEYMKSVGRLGGQNKVARLSNDRNIADALQQWIQ